MQIAKRIGLFLLVNLLVILTVSVLLRVFHVAPYLNAHGLDVGSLLIFCGIWGMAGAFISLALSKPMAKWLMGVQILSDKNLSGREKELVEMVKELSRKAKLSKCPEVGIYSSKEVNAFATGATQRSSLIAVSTGLLDRMGKDELEGVLAHEMAHIANGDMVTMALLQGVINAFVMFLARILAYAISMSSRDRQSSSGVSGSYYLLVMLFEVVLMLLGGIVIATFSRFREFRADKGGATLAGRSKMIAALESLKATIEVKDPRTEKPAIAAFKISVRKPSGIMALFSTHPPLEKRIERLKSES